MTLPLAILSIAISGVALGVTVYLNLYREKRLRPRLGLAPDVPIRGVDLVSFDYPDEPGCAEHWLRLRVRNEKDRRTAEDVEVSFVGCAADDGVSSDMPLDWRRLRWSATAQAAQGIDVLSREAAKPELTATIPPGFFRHVDVLHTSNRAKVTGDARACPRICVWPTPSHRNLLGAGRYKLFFAITAKDANASFYSMCVTFDGSWSDDADEWWGTHLVVEAPRKVDADSVPGGI